MLLKIQHEIKKTLSERVGVGPADLNEIGITRFFIYVYKLGRTPCKYAVLM